MRHRVYGRHLGRNIDERERLFKGLVSELFLHGTIQTSSAKAKAIKGLVDKVINFAKKKNFNNLSKLVTDKNLQERLIKDIVPKMGTKTSGFTSLERIGARLGDQTMMVKMSLIGAEQLKSMEKVTSNPSTRFGAGRGLLGKTRGRQGTVKTEEQKKIISAKKITSKKPVVRKRVAKKK